MIDTKIPEPVKPGYMERDKKEKEKEKGLATYDQDRIKRNVGLGISGIDPADVMPAQLKLVQGSSDLSKLVTGDGTQAKVGNFFFQGNKTVHEKVICYVLNLAKVNDPFNQRDDGSYEKMYRMIAVFDDFKTTFSMNFRRGAIDTIKNFLGEIFSQKRGAYSFKIEISFEQKTGKKGNYLVPLIKILETVKNAKVLNLLERGVMKYEFLSKVTGDENLSLSIPKNVLPEPAGEIADTTEPMDENIDPDDIPF